MNAARHSLKFRCVIFSLIATVTDTFVAPSSQRMLPTASRPGPATSATTMSTHRIGRRVALQTFAATCGLCGAAQRSAASSAAAALPVCDQAVDVWQEEGGAGRRVYVVGTAHISNVSALLVRDVIRAVGPDSVMVELDASRVISSAPGPGQGPAPSTRNKSPNLIGGIKETLGAGVGGVADSAKAFLLGFALRNLYAMMDRMGFQSGEEFSVAMAEANSIGAKLILGDQDVRVTLLRLQDALKKSDLQKLISMDDPELESLMMGFASPTASNKPMDLANPTQLSQTIELIKARNNTSRLTQYMSKELPEVYAAMLGERDAFMANSLRQAGGAVTVAVVGIAHMDGIGSNLGYRKVKLDVCV